MEFFNHLWQSAAVLSLFYLVYVLFLRKDTLFEAKRHYFLTGILVALFLPFVKITQTVYKVAPVMENSTFTNDFIAVTQSPITQSTTENSIDWPLVLLAAYLLGILVFLVRLVIQSLSLLKLIRSYPITRKGKYRFVQVSEPISPFSFFRYIVYNPEMHTQTELEMILQHEKIHVSQWHSLDILLGNFIQIAQWINPFSWLYKRSMEENLEFIADGKTVTRVASKTQYQLTMVKASSAWTAPSLTINFYQSFIKKRIVMLNKQHSKKRNALKAIIILPLLAIFLWSFNVQEVIQYEEPEVPTISETETPSENEFIFSETEPEEPSLEETAILEEAETIPRRRRIAPEDTIKPEPSESKLGKNPLYIINGKEIRKSELPEDNEIDIRGEINVYYPKEAVEKFGRKGSDGIVILNGNVNQISKAVNTFTFKGSEFRYRIHKDISDAELNKMKDELKRKHGIDMSYSVVRNSKGEITTINMSYSGKSRNGSYSITEDDGEPIEEFEFYMNEEGRSGFYSEAHERRREERMAHRLARMEERNAERIARREEQLSRRLEDQKERTERRRAEMEEGQDEMREEREKMMEERKMELAQRMKERENEMKEREMELREQKRRVASVGDRENVFVHSTSGHSSHVIITKNTTDAELMQMKKDLAKEGVTFTYKRVKRNSNGEIISIKIDVKDGNGRSQTSIRSDTDNPIEDVIVEY